MPRETRLDYARQRSSREPDVPRGVRTRRVGEVAGLKVWLVSGEKLRNGIDTDFTCGGNPSRYNYCPSNEIWIDDCLGPLDAVATIAHELHEHLRMQDGDSYETAHDKATAMERVLRASLAHRPPKRLTKKWLRRAETAATK